MLKNEPFFGGRLFDHEFSPFLGRSFTAEFFRVRSTDISADYTERNFPPSEGGLLIFKQTQ
ncbi:hypothetical protein LHA01_19930 [Schleiferilactobacillus harbinensis]|nr:hypothetical protein LHA01_19930 [Schleiferilactobacillus harbinensis]